MAAAAVVVAVLVNAVADQAGIPPWLISAPSVGGAFALLFAWFDRIGWRSRWANRFGLNTIPSVEGVYVGELISTYDNQLVPVSIAIEQTWTKVTVRLHVIGSDRTSDSYSTTAAIDSIGRHRARLRYTYRSTINPGVADSDIDDHDGTATLDVETDSGRTSGRYYNGRCRRGTITAQMDER